MNINVIAKKLGYYGLKRRKEGAHFQMKLKDFTEKEEVAKPEGKEFFSVNGKEYLIPSWIEIVDSVATDKPKKAKSGKVQDEPLIDQDDVI